ncbi:DNA repair protein complementing XP-C cells homolog [Scaptodrosophila lebanonensis]|uniref:DNA repair protein complementing XP-C cells homolog n=1 Tax=Drosophila lebanonensis TaxID=7225 RepID=A0A6J2TNU1_DROLE|nr:DNA repair protein complementing XP-C cells homolog [Scaptodrosophila lebanonensis]
MSDEEDESLSEGFSASEDEWKPTKDVRGGESSDDDDSDFEEAPAAGAAVGGASARALANTVAGKKREQKQPSGIKGASVKKRKPSGQSLRSKLYNKYRPPPKTFPTSPSQNSPSASSSNRATASKNARTPNESGARERNVDSSSESSVEDYLVNPADIDLGSTFFTAPAKDRSPAPQFDCNAGIANLSDSGSEDNNESSIEESTTNAFDFRSLLENANSLERTKDALAKRTATAAPPSQGHGKKDAKTAAMDVNALLALGENQNYDNGPSVNEKEYLEKQPLPDDGPPRLSKTKSTRVKRHTKTRPASTVVAENDTDDSEWEEVAGAIDEESDCDVTPNVSGDLEIHVDLPSRHANKEKKTQHDLELALKRRMNRDIKDKQLLLHKVSLMCLIARSYKYNRLLGHTSLMQAALKLLPSKNAYPTQRGTELKYLQSFVTWFKTAVKLTTPNLYPEKTSKSKTGIIDELLAQIKRKEARCKQDMIFIFIVLARGMGMHCRLIVNMQPLPLRPATADLIPIKLKEENASTNQKNNTQPNETDEGNDDANDDESIQKASKKSKQKNASKTKSLEQKREKTSTKSNLESSSKTKDNDKEKSTTRITLKIETKGNSKAAEQNASKNYVVHDKPSTSRSQHKEEVKSKISSSSENEAKGKPKLSRLKRSKTTVTNVDAETIKKPKLSAEEISTQVNRTRKALGEKEKQIVPNECDLPKVQIGSPIIPKVVLQGTRTTKRNIKNNDSENANPSSISQLKPPETRSRSKSPKVHISPTFLQTNIAMKKTVGRSKLKTTAERTNNQDGLPTLHKTNSNEEPASEKMPVTRQLRTRQQKAMAAKATGLSIPQFDGADDSVPVPKKRPKLEKLQKSRSNEDSDEDFEPSPAKPVKKSPMLPKAVQNLRKDRRVLSTDDEAGGKEKRKSTAADMWIEIWSEVEEQWICIDLFKGKLHCVDTIRKSASSNLAYVFAFQDDLSLKDVTARYCPSWTTTVRKGRVEKAWLDETLTPYLGRRTKRDIVEDQQLRRIHEEKPMPKSISEFKDHPLYVLERHLLKFQALYPPDAPTLGFIRGEPIYARECVHLLHSRDIWLKQARVVKLGEQPYKIVKARPKWDKLTRTVIKDQPLEIFGFWQTQDYEPPTAEGGLVPRNAYGNVELFKACMLPKKTVHLRLPGLMRICKKLNIDCANAVVGFDFHQGACHPMYDGFVVCEEFQDQVTAAWYQDQEERQRKEQEKYEARVYGNWKKLIKGLIIRERLKKKYNF